MPIPNECHNLSVIMPSIEELSQWILTVKNLKEGDYEIKIDDIKVATVSSDNLSKGWNMGLLENGPVADQGRQILSLISKKEEIVSQWRTESKKVFSQAIKETNNTNLEELSKQIFAADKEIKNASQPKTHHFVIIPTSATSK